MLAVTAATVPQAPRSVFVRAADAIHLICARESGFREIYTGDRHMTAAAPYSRMRAVTIPAERG